MRHYDFSPLMRSAIGFDDLFRLTDSLGRGDKAELAYPPYNIEKTGDDAYRISMAVAGFSEDELEVTVKEDMLVIEGRATEAAEEEEKTFLHRGIAKRAFERRFRLADTIRVTGAGFENGLLNVELLREIPEHRKPRIIEIGAGKIAKVIEGERAA
ncbi:MAG: Hsp20 family protein [Proteobacteria bacterium]|nr:Hsp20 family protein [Pseudomonadota bacterium]